MANFYDVELRDLLPLTGSEKSNEINLRLKPRSVLKTLMDVFTGMITLQQAMALTSSSKISLTLILTHWGDELPTLYTTLEQLDEKRIDLEEACRRLNVTKYTLHGIRRKYGYAPGHRGRTRPMPTLPQRKETSREAALACITGNLTAHEAAHRYGISERTIFRSIERLSPIKLTDLAPWPKVFREAFAVELTKEMPKYVQKWFEFTKDARLFMEKTPKYPKLPTDWRQQPLKRLLITVLLGEHTIEEIADLRGADPNILRSLFTGDLRPLDLTFEGVEQLPVIHQIALAELLTATLNRKRKVPA